MEDANFQSKISIRNKIKSIRKSLDPNFKIEASNTVLNFVKNWQPYIKAQNIGLYSATSDELNTKNLTNNILENNKRCYLPIINNDNSFNFYLYDRNISLSANKYDILEPKATLQNKIDINLLDIIFTPLVAFDNNKNRLGMGGGYYDNTLKKINFNTIKRPLIVGLAFALQKVNQLPSDPWDIKLDFVITEDGIF